jgi:hypothetical protein
LIVGVLRRAAHSFVGASKLSSTPEPLTASRSTSRRSDSSISWITGPSLLPQGARGQHRPEHSEGSLVCPKGH